MPLDPIFAERLRVHRRYLFDKARASARARLAALWPFGRFGPPPATPPSARTATAGATAQAVAAPAAAPGPRDAAGRPPRGPRARARARHRKAALAWDRKELATVGTPGPDIPTEERRVEPDGLPPFRVRIYRPAERDADPVPGCLALFGGAFRIGGIDYPTTDAGYRRRAADSGVAIVAVDYALAPEHRFPTQIEQAHAALEWLYAHAEGLGIRPDRIGIMGTSAGANLAAVVTLMNRERGRLPIRLQILEVPVTDLSGKHIDYAATRALGIPSLLARRELRSVARTYLRDARDARTPLASPLLARSHAELPPAVVLTAEYDPLRGDGAAYGAALREDGVEASVVRYLGVTHDTPIFTAVLPAARRWHDDVVAALRRLHEEQESGWTTSSA
ncbi:alpha/beta hydrolase [Microbacterium sp. BK668]|uniref:alpha/beta hydrolase n=1 Tax=Microbacterium sp. BK668 TaxID=2512118 RepID=UPI00105E2BA5|nr:alpha/beta hydrolase [Microbacterium sp. BK668]TDN91121.1 acetyl esterase [Microbacterium sp. BK668]